MILLFQLNSSTMFHFAAALTFGGRIVWSASVATKKPYIHIHIHIVHSKQIYSTLLHYYWRRKWAYFSNITNYSNIKGIYTIIAWECVAGKQHRSGMSYRKWSRIRLPVGSIAPLGGGAAGSESSRLWRQQQALCLQGMFWTAELKRPRPSVCVV